MRSFCQWLVAILLIPALLANAETINALNRNFGSVAPSAGGDFTAEALNVRSAFVPESLAEPFTRPVAVKNFRSIEETRKRFDDKGIPSFALLPSPWGIGVFKKIMAGVIVLVVAGSLATMNWADRNGPSTKRPINTKAGQIKLLGHYYNVYKLLTPHLAPVIAATSHVSTKPEKNKGLHSEFKTKELIVQLPKNLMNDALHTFLSSESDASTYTQYVRINIPNPANVRSISLSLEDNNLHVTKVGITGLGCNLEINEASGDINRSVYNGKYSEFAGTVVTTVNPHLAIRQLQNPASLQFEITLKGPPVHSFIAQNVIAYVLILYDGVYEAIGDSSDQLSGRESISTNEKTHMQSRPIRRQA